MRKTKLTGGRQNLLEEDRTYWRKTEPTGGRQNLLDVDEVLDMLGYFFFNRGREPYTKSGVVESGGEREW